MEEEVDGRVVFNQPAGHLEPGESLAAAAIRETLEETGYHFVPEAVVGIYRWRNPASDATYLRVAFTGTLTGHEPERPLDTGIVGPVWFDTEALRQNAPALRSPMVMRCIDDYRAGCRYPLELLRDLG